MEAQIGHMLNLDVPRSMPTKTLDVDSITKSSRNQHTSQVLYLVRDPRAVYASRKTLSWCANSSCSSIESLCDEMTRDFDSYESYVAARLLDRDVEDDKTINLTVARLKVRLIRFEDLALTPIQETKRLYKALGLSFTASVERYVRTHTGQGLSWSDPVLFDRNHSLPLSATLSSSTSLAVHKKRLARLAHLQLTREIRNPHSTRRESRQIPFAWHRSLRWNQVQQVQQACARVMQRLGYRVISENEFSSLNEENAVATLITKLPALSYDE